MDAEAVSARTYIAMPDPVRPTRGSPQPAI